jgi:Cu+-exporting ATPase
MSFSQLAAAPNFMQNYSIDIMQATSQFTNYKDAAAEKTPHKASNECHHCGEPCDATDPIKLDDKQFCCHGCKTVFEILSNNDMCQYYDLDEQAGISLKGRSSEEYAFLDATDIQEKLVDYRDADHTKVTFFIPQIHCASCIWLLEKLYRLHPGVTTSKVNFVQKEAYITFEQEQISLRQLVELLASLGYAPSINLSNLDRTDKPIIDRSFYYKLGVAGFAFGNIMLLSFPEYLGLNKTMDPYFFHLFGYLNILLALPLVFYSGQGYLQSAWNGLKQRVLNIDVPISIGILTLFVRSVYEIVSHTGAGFLDSLAGLVFFLLVGKWFQQRTYHSISFERDYQSYFPIAANRIKNGEVAAVTLDKLEEGDNILVKHNELIPADSILLKGNAQIDYSFVTGESEPVTKKTGEKIYAGGRQIGEPIELSIIRRVSQSYLTQLWNDEAFTKKQEVQSSKIADRVGKIFTIVILLTAFTTLFYWLPKDTNIAINSFTAVLIIACPCAVALAIPFIFGNAVRVMGRHHFFLKNTSIIEQLNLFKVAVFDKTGTLTQRQKGEITFVGEPLSPHEARMIIGIVSASNHPISQQIAAYLSEQAGKSDEEVYKVKDWMEHTAKGVEGIICQRKVKVGSTSFVDAYLEEDDLNKNGVYIQFNHEMRGYFLISNHFREGIWKMADYIKTKAKMYLLSGDNPKEQHLLAPIFKDNMFFGQSPKDKLDFIKELQQEGSNVLMLGDGLNDSGALKQSDIGIVIAEDTNNFTPACDAILQAKQFKKLPVFIEYARRSINLVYMAYGFAVIYNVIGLSFAVQGALSPIVAAILMPLSSISIVVFGMMASNGLARRLGL